MTSFWLINSTQKGEQGFSGGSVIKESTCQCKRRRFDPWIGKIPWRRKWQPTPVFLPGKSHGQKSLVGYSPWGHKESNTTERAHTHTCLDYSYCFWSLPALHTHPPTHKKINCLFLPQMLLKHTFCWVLWHKNHLSLFLPFGNSQ